MAELNDTWPEFLDALERRPRRAARELYEFTVRVARVAPPPVFRSLPHDMAVDVLYDVVLTCVQERFALLRTYQKDTHPFAFWIRRILSERSAEWLRRETEAGFVPDADEGIVFQQIIRAAQTARQGLSLEDQLLLEMVIDGLRPFEMLRLLRWPATQKELLQNRIQSCQQDFYVALKAVLQDEEVEWLDTALLWTGSGDDILVGWKHRQLKRIVAGTRQPEDPHDHPAEFEIQCYLQDTATKEQREEVLRALARSGSFRDELLNRIEELHPEFLPEVVLEFQKVRVGRVPDFSDYLQSRSLTGLSVRGLLSRWRLVSKKA